MRKGNARMELETKRLQLRPWLAEDASWLYEYAKDPAVGPAAGWPAHRDIEESRALICTVLNGPACYAICEKVCGHPIGTIELKLPGKTELTDRATECELGYWLGRPFWGRGYMPEAARTLLRYGFTELEMEAIWCGYYTGNEKSKRVQEKLGFVPHHLRRSAPVPLLGEMRDEQINVLTKARWAALCEK